MHMSGGKEVHRFSSLCAAQPVPGLRSDELARSLVGVLQAFEALDVESDNSVYVQQCAGMNLSLLWKICRQPSDIDVIDGEGLGLDKASPRIRSPRLREPSSESLRQRPKP